MIRFHFELCPLDQVLPWGRGHDTLHWFGLTEGWYWIEAGGHQLLRRARADDARPDVDYYLARLWEDVGILTPVVMEVVPAEVEAFIASERAQWRCDPLDFIPAGGDPDAPDHPAVTAAAWRSDHYLDFGYLRNAPSLRFWRTVRDGRDEMTLDWRHGDDGEIGFTAGSALRFSVPADAYLDAVHTFDRELMAAMEQRVEEVERRGGLPGVKLDVAGLRREHEDRTHWLARKLEHSPRTDWAMVGVGARRLLGRL